MSVYVGCNCITPIFSLAFGFSLRIDVICPIDTCEYYIDLLKVIDHVHYITVRKKSTVGLLVFVYSFFFFVKGHLQL